MTGRPKYFEEFLEFWSGKREVKKVWFSLFTPQKGAQGEEILTPDQRSEVLTELIRLRSIFQRWTCLIPSWGYRKPPRDPDECIFARTTLNITADLKGKIVPCQFGGDPDCSQCGCLASAGNECSS
jgi:hypothetical protein